MFELLPLELKLMIFNNLNKKELKKIESVSKGFKILANNKSLLANKEYSRLVFLLKKKLLELFSMQQKSKNFDRFSRFDEYKINIHTDFSILKANIISLLEIINLHDEVFKSKITKSISETILRLNKVASWNCDTQEEKQSVIFQCHQDLELLIKKFSYDSNLVSQMIGKFVKLIINVQPSLYKIKRESSVTWYVMPMQ